MVVIEGDFPKSHRKFISTAPRYIKKAAIIETIPRSVFTYQGDPYKDFYFSTAGLLYARNLYVGPLDECLAYPCAFPTTLPAELDLPPIKGNYCEGIVLKPLDPVVLTDGTRISVKKKSCNI